MNPQALKKRSLRKDKEKIARVFSRIAVIPYNKVATKNKLGESMTFQSEMKPLIERAIQSIGTILELSVAFASMQSDVLFEEVLELSNELSDLDMRAQFNYSLLLFSTGKVNMFFKHKFVARKCACGEALGFKVAAMLQFISVSDVQMKGDVLRSFVRRKGIGCNGVKLRFADTTQHHSTHIRRRFLPTDLLAKLDSAVTGTINQEDAGPLDTIIQDTASSEGQEETGPLDTTIQDIASSVTETEVLEEAAPLDTTIQDTASSVTGTIDQAGAGPVDNIIQDTVSSEVREDAGPFDINFKDTAASAKAIPRCRHVKRPRNILEDNLSGHFKPSGKRSRRLKLQ
ncbi:uncharacterized protein [Montipora capricornis]